MTLNFLNMLGGIISAETERTLNVPTHSIDFESASSQYLSMTDANFGAFDRAKFAISVWVKRESSASVNTIMAQSEGNTATRAFELAFADDQILFRGSNGSSNFELQTTATNTSTIDWYHILVHYDSANATAGDRMKMWVDGTEITSFTSDVNPSSAIQDVATDVYVGGRGAVSLHDGRVYQLAFFSGYLPSIGEVYRSGGPNEINGLAGLHSFLSVAGGSVIADAVLASDWTNNNSATASTATPA